MLRLFKRLGKFFKLLDHDNTLSLTNIAVWVTLVKLATSSNAVSPVDVGALVGTLLAHQTKKYIAKMENKGYSEATPDANA